ncbi:carbon catabolite repressor protein 4 homolog 6 isoform X2 [Punica granatum]|uniref:Carbon catabolite repressor protein 4 homolog 6 isoform X2 n=1 Tax=Punica granatum TaxID=22663 RepID=A0A6P8BTP4_PUNGR|nr:carbon catabolite repressor protein 4 homolog 6 isoform X2 [Punica granatum]
MACFAERFVVLSYNILADYLALNHRSKLYYHIPRYMLDWDWRKRNIIFELGLWSADIMCFQEVDRFQDLEEELKFRGYCGIWKMRTGDPVDGCAIFWRTSRFKLLHEEFIEFSKLGLRDNVAQICVLELVSEDSSEDVGNAPISSTGSNKIVVCNIHVLYNPKRGEIKLGQIRVLLDSAHVVSKSWDNSPIVLCGDFNCTPKSPLYNFISEQKLDLSGIDRDKVSGQASAEIRETKPNFHNNRELSTDRTIQDPLNVESLDEHKHSSPDVEDILIKDDLSPQQSCTNGQVQDTSDHEEANHEATKNDTLISVDVTSDENISSSLASYDNTVESSSSLGGRDFPEDMGIVDKVEKKSSEHCSVLADEMERTAIEANDTIISISVTAVDSSFNPSANDEDSAAESLDEQLKVLSLNEVDEPNVEGGGSSCEDDTAFLAALHEGEDSPQLGSPSGLEFEPVEEGRTSYDPSVWTPTEIATATGSGDCLVLEHKLKLKSTYTEVEDLSRTRNDIGEPLVTSYNSRFMGTVDYIWRSEGLQTIKVLAPIPKQAMQWTQGFPTKKWGSDHIALVSELTLTGGNVSDQEAQCGDTP